MKGRNYIQKDLGVLKQQQRQEFAFSLRSDFEIHQKKLQEINKKSSMPNIKTIKDQQMSLHKKKNKSREFQKLGNSSPALNTNRGGCAAAKKQPAAHEEAH